MKLKKIFLPITLIFTILILASCSLIKEDKNIKVVDKDIKFTNYSNEYDIKSKSIKTYFIDDGITPYVECQSFIEALDGYTNMKDISFSKSPIFNEFRLNLKLNGIITVSSVFNWDRNTIRLTDLLATSISKETSSTDFLKHLKTVSQNVEGGSSVTLDLAKFGFDILYNNGRVLVPFSIMNFIYCSQNYYNIYYNGEEYFGQYLVITTKNEEYSNVYKDALKNKEVSQELRNETYNFMSFVMHYFYGLNDMNPNVEDDLKSLESEIKSTNPLTFMGGEAKFINQKLNELHSGIISTSYYVNPNQYNKSEYESENSKKYSSVLNSLKSAKSTNFGSESFPTIRYNSNTAIIYFPSFVTAQKSEIYNEDGSVKDDAYKYDTYELMRYAMSDIEKHSDVKKVVFDLSTNGGGNLAALLKTLGFITNDEIVNTNYNLLNKRKTFLSVLTDVKDNGTYGKDAYTKYDYYIQTSFLTYSSANIMSGIAKNYKYATIIGQKSGGGMCAIVPIVFPDGTAVQISGNTQMRIKSGTELIPIEKGVDVDIQIDYKDFYNDAKLVEIINRA